MTGSRSDVIRILGITILEETGRRYNSWPLMPGQIALVEEAEKLCPQRVSVTAFTFRVDTPCMYISASVSADAFSERS